MDGPGFDAAVPFDPAQEVVPEPGPVTEHVETIAGAEDISLVALAAELERDPGECWRAFQGLESIELEDRLRIIEGLSELAVGPGVRGLLQVLASQGDEQTRPTARKVMERWDRGHLSSSRPAIAEAMGERAQEEDERSLERIGGAAAGSREIVRIGSVDRPDLVDSLVTTVDGAGRGTIGLSARRDGRRVTALFLCDVERGVRGAIGQVEEESDQAGGLLREFRAQEAGDGLAGAGELALGLLAGELLLNGPSVPAAVSHWLEQTVGSGFRPRAFLTSNGETELAPIESTELLLRAYEIIEACPTWLDRSTLTYELAEEIVLREGKSPADPRRDSGVFRFLFEHRLIHRLEQYGRMLLWMSRFWECSGEADLGRSAQEFAVQLADEQYAVPAHPFAVALTARSLNAAQERLGTKLDPRATRWRRGSA